LKSIVLNSLRNKDFKMTTNFIEGEMDCVVCYAPEDYRYESMKINKYVNVDLESCLTC
jgi:hypothetical protein